MIDQTETERLFRNIIDVCGYRLTIGDVLEVNEWISHREYGIALETIIDMLMDAPVPQDIIQHIKVLAISMEMLDCMVNLVAEE